MRATRACSDERGRRAVVVPRAAVRSECEAFVATAVLFLRACCCTGPCCKGLFVVVRAVVSSREWRTSSPHPSSGGL
eukprot:SAG11_NODE_278_length_11284_cov_202.732231_13_plen_77_part_00